MQLYLGCQHSGEEILLRANCGNCTHNEAIVRGGWGEITHSVRPFSVKHKPFYHHLQTLQTNSLSRLQYSTAVGTNVLLYLSRLLLMNRLANTGLGITAPVVRQVQSSNVIFTLVKYSQLFKVFRTIGQNGDGESVMSDANFRKFTQTLVAGF